MTTRDQCASIRPYDPSFSQVTCTQPSSCCSIYGMCGSLTEPHCGESYNSAFPALSMVDPKTYVGTTKSSTIGAYVFFISCCFFSCCILMFVLFMFMPVD